MKTCTVCAGHFVLSDYKKEITHEN